MQSVEVIDSISSSVFNSIKKNEKRKNLIIVDEEVEEAQEVINKLMSVYYTVKFSIYRSIDEAILDLSLNHQLSREYLIFTKQENTSYISREYPTVFQYLLSNRIIFTSKVSYLRYFLRK